MSLVTIKSTNKDSLSVAAISLNTTPLDFAGNKKLIAEAVVDPASQKADVLLFPELCIPSYSCQDYFFYPEVEKRSLQALDQTRSLDPKKLMLVGLALRLDQKLFNCAAYVYGGDAVSYTHLTLPTILLV